MSNKILHKTQLENSMFFIEFSKNTEIFTFAIQPHCKQMISRFKKQIFTYCVSLFSFRFILCSKFSSLKGKKLHMAR